MKYQLSKKSKALAFAAAISLMSGMSGCSSTSAGGSGGGDTTQVAITSVDELPQSVNPVESGSSVSAIVLNGVGSAASTGMPLGSLDGSDFSSTDSLAACEMYNQTKWAISSGVQGDLIQCYVTHVMTAGEDVGLLTSDIDDGSYHILALEAEGVGDDGPPNKIKVKITKNDSGNVTGFEFFACRGEEGSMEQSQYIRQTIDGHNFTMTSKETGSHTDERLGVERTHRQSVIVTGTLNDAGAFVDSFGGESTPKQILMRFINEAGDQESFHGAMDVNQYHDRITLDGVMGGTHTFESEGEEFNCENSNQIFAAAQLIEGNTDPSDYNIGLLALGDGAVYRSFSGSCGEGDEHTDAGYEAWNGDTYDVVDDYEATDYFEDVNDYELQSDETPIVAFEGDEVWDCSGTAEETIDFSAIEAARAASDLPGPMEECANLELNHSHIDCWQIIEENRHDDREGDGAGGGGGIEISNFYLLDHTCAESGLSEGTAYNHTNLQTACTCNSIAAETCSAIESTICNASTTMGECQTAVQDYAAAHH